MSRFRRLEVVEHSPSSSSLSSHHYYLLKQTSSIFNPPPPLLLNPWVFPIVEDDLFDNFTLKSPLLLLNYFPPSSDFDTVTDLIQIRQTPTRRHLLQALSDRVSALELGLDRLVREELKERKYSWTAQIKSPESHRKYKWTAEKKGLDKKSYKLTAEIQRKGAETLPIEQTYTIKVSTVDSSSDESVVDEKKKKKKKTNEKLKKEKCKSTARIVEIQEPSDNGGLVLRQAFAKRVDKRRGKRKEFCPQDAATLIQKSFRAYLIRRSQALRALRELAIAKSKLKEIRALFNNFSYRRRLAGDAEERQRFSEKIIVLLLTVDAIEGADLIVRAAKRSMVDELEAMLDVVDPQPPGKSLSMRRRTFDMPDGVINKELATGVAQVVRMLDQEATSSETFEACL